MPPKLPSKEKSSIDEAAADAKELFAIAAIAVAAAGVAAAAGRGEAIGYVDEDATTTNVPLTARVVVGGGIAVGRSGRLGDQEIE